MPKGTRSDLAGSNFGGAEFLGNDCGDLNLEATDKPQRVAGDDGNEIFLPSNKKASSQRCFSYKKFRASKRRNGLGLDQMEFLGRIDHGSSKKTAEFWEKESSLPRGLQKTSSN